ncbi:MAG: hypothetical protein IT445_07665 [Phycisphaeraceae bacterium]|nr:hypothetical protein [Phycisphaeraceae bacterium]
MKIRQRLTQLSAVVTAMMLMAAGASADLFGSAVVHYEFETLGGTGEVTDSGPNGVDLLVAAGTTANLVTGIVGNGMQIYDPGNTNLVVLTTTGTTSDDSILNVTRDTPVSISAWVKLENVGDRLFIASKMIRNVPGGSGSTDLRGWSFDISANTGKLTAIWRYDNTPDVGTVGENRIIIDSTTLITDTNWHHVGLSYGYNEADAYRGFQIYVDGQASGMTAVSTGLAGASDWDLSAQDAPFNFGGRYDAQLNEGGNVDEFGFWNATLTPLQMQSLYLSVVAHAGDANNDGLVNLSDLQILGDNWQSTTAGWSSADFNGDEAVNLADLQILGDNWGFGAGPDLSFDEALAAVGIVIPEPATMALISLALPLGLRRRENR